MKKIFKSKNKILSFLLAILMLLSTFSSILVYAKERTENNIIINEQGMNDDKFFYRRTEDGLMVGGFVSYDAEEAYKEYLAIPDFYNNEKVIGVLEKAFEGGSIENLSLGSNIKIIKKDAFKNVGLKHIEFNGNLESIENGAFSNNNLLDVKLPKTEHIAEDAFIGNEIRDFVFEDNNHEFNQENQTISKISENEISSDIIINNNNDDEKQDSNLIYNMIDEDKNKKENEDLKNKELEKADKNNDKIINLEEPKKDDPQVFEERGNQVFLNGQTFRFVEPEKLNKKEFNELTNSAEENIIKELDNKKEPNTNKKDNSIIGKAIKGFSSIFINKVFATEKSDSNIGAIVSESEADGTKIESINSKWVKTNNSHQTLDWRDQGDSEKTVSLRTHISLSGQHNYDIGTIQIVLPKKIFRDRTGALTGYSSLGVPEMPGGQAQLAYYEDAENYIIINTKKIPAASQLMFEMTFRGLIPHEIKDKVTGYKTDEYKPYVQVLTQGNHYIKKVSNPLTADVDTSEELTYAKKEAGYVYEEWPNSWPSSLKPTDGTEDDYVYCSWSTYGQASGNQPFNIDFSDNADPKINQYTNNAKILGIRRNADMKMYTDITTSNYTLPDKIYPTNGEFAYQGTYDGYYSTIYVAYPKENFFEYKGKDSIGKKMFGKSKARYFDIYNTCEYNLTSEDDKQVTKQSAQAKVRYVPIVSKFPRGHFIVRKYPKGRYPIHLNILDHDKSVEVLYSVDTVAFGLPWTSNSETAPLPNAGSFAGEDTEVDLSTFEKVPYGIEIRDFETRFNGGRVLRKDEFEFASLSINTPTMYSYKKFKTDGYGYFEDPRDNNISYGFIPQGRYGYYVDKFAPIPKLTVLASFDEEGSYKPVAEIDFENSSNSKTFNGASLDGNKVIFPKGVTDYKVKCGTKKAAITWTMYPSVRLHPCDLVKGQLSELFENSQTPQAPLYNKVDMNTFLGKEKTKTFINSDHAQDMLQGFSYGVYAKKDLSYRNEKDKRNVRLRYTSRAYFHSNLENESDLKQVIDWGYYNEEKSCTWYDLLPFGAEPDISTIRGRGGDKVTDIDIIRDYKKSGQTLLKVKMDLSPSYSYGSGTITGKPGLEDTPTLYFEANYSWDNITDISDTLRNHIVYESDNDKIGKIKDLRGESDDPYGTNNRYTRDLVKGSYRDILKDLNPNRGPSESFIYGVAENVVNVEKYAVTSLSKYVSTDQDGIFKDGLDETDAANVYENGKYYYRFRIHNPYGSSSDDIVFYDKLEGYIPTIDKLDNEDKQWKGKLLDIDTSRLTRKGVAPVVYYSEKKDIVLDNTDDRSDNDLSNANIWKKFTSSDYEDGKIKKDLADKITAIAVDCRRGTNGSRFILRENEAISFDIEMQAPDLLKDLDLDGKKYAKNLDEKGKWYDHLRDIERIDRRIVTIPLPGEQVENFKKQVLIGTNLSNAVDLAERENKTLSVKNAAKEFSYWAETPTSQKEYEKRNIEKGDNITLYANYGIAKPEIENEKGYQGKIKDVNPDHPDSPDEGYKFVTFYMNNEGEGESPKYVRKQIKIGAMLSDAVKYLDYEKTMSSVKKGDQPFSFWSTEKDKYNEYTDFQIKEKLDFPELIAEIDTVKEELASLKLQLNKNKEKLPDTKKIQNYEKVIMEDEKTKKELTNKINSNEKALDEERKKTNPNESLIKSLENENQGNRQKIASIDENIANMQKLITEEKSKETEELKSTIANLEKSINEKEALMENKENELRDLYNKDINISLWAEYQETVRDDNGKTTPDEGYEFVYFDFNGGTRSREKTYVYNINVYTPEKEFEGGAHAYNNGVAILNVMNNEDLNKKENLLIRHDYTKVGLKTFKINIDKSFKDEKNRDRIRPESVKIYLLKNGERTGDFITLSSENEWKNSFNNLLFIDEKGDIINYSFEEEGDKRYKLEIADSRIEGDTRIVSLKNVYNPEKISIKVNKNWKDVVEYPSSVTYILKADGKEIDRKTIEKNKNGNTNWSYEFKDLYKYRENPDQTSVLNETERKKHEIIYDVEEEYMEDFKIVKDDSKKDKKEFTFTNIYYPYGDLKISKQVKDASNNALSNEFTFTIFFKDKTIVHKEGEEEKGSEIPDYMYEKYNEGSNKVIESGKVTNGTELTLKDNQYILIKDIDTKMTYNIVEHKKDGFKASVESINGNIKSGETNEANFINTYNTYGEISLEAFKDLDGRKLGSRQFRFEIRDKNETTKDKDGNIIRLGEVLSTGFNDENGNISFSPIKYTNKDLGYKDEAKTKLNDETTKVYYISEVNRGASGYTYDSNVIKCLVTLKDNGNGKIITDVKYKKEDGSLFNWGYNGDNTFGYSNKYKAEGSVEIKAWKFVKHNKDKDNSGFKFDLNLVAVNDYETAERKENLYEKDIKTATAYDESKLKSPFDKRIHYSMNNDLFEKENSNKYADKKIVAVSDPEGNVTFNPIDFNQYDAGKVFVFDVKEIGHPNLDPSLKDPMIYDVNTIRYYLSVHDNGTGKLSFNSDYEFIPNKDISLEDYKTWAIKMLQAFEAKTLTNPEEIKDKNKEISDKVGAMKTKEEIAKEINLSSENFPLFINDYKPGNLTVKKQVLNGDKDKFFAFKLKIGNTSEELPEGEFKLRTERIYDGMEFVGEVEGNSLITYDKLISDLGIKFSMEPMILRSGHEEICDKYQEEKSKGGIWLKFIDHKYTRNGKPRTFYVMKKPARCGVSWDTLYTAGAVYGWDVIDPATGKPMAKKVFSYNNYQAKIITIDGEKYIVRLLQGETNYGGDVTSTKKRPTNTTGFNSEWNRTILPITKDYRFGNETDNNKYLESELREKDGENYKIQTAGYNWFGDLTLGSMDDWFYNGKSNSGISYAGQLNWIQEFNPVLPFSPRNYRGSSSIPKGAAFSSEYESKSKEKALGVRLVIEPLGSYDGMEFAGEVEGNSLITYDNLISELGITEGSKPTIERTGHKEIYDKYQEENAKGGIWLKFIDYKYTRNGKPRTFYVMKKPARMGVSWNTLHTAGAVYGWDVIDPANGKPKYSPEKFQNIGSCGTQKDYQAKIIKIKGEKYIVRLLQGKTNYGKNVTNRKLWYDKKQNANSEWNRTILPITKDYRFGDNTGKAFSTKEEDDSNNDYVESVLREKDGDNYKIQTFDYNWFGDLTLGSNSSFYYKGKENNGLKNENLVNKNWVQEFGGYYTYRSTRGSKYVSVGAANSDSDYSSNTNNTGVRLVIEPYNN